MVRRGGFFLLKNPRFIYLLRFSSPLAVEEDTVQAAVMPPAPGSVLVMMRSLTTLKRFAMKVHGRHPADRFPNVPALFLEALTCARSALIRRSPPRETLGPRRCRLLTIWGEE